MWRGNIGPDNPVPSVGYPTIWSGRTAACKAESTTAGLPLRADQPTTGGRYWVRTSDLFGVNEARYHCANRPRGLTLADGRGGRHIQTGASALAGGRFACPVRGWLWLPAHRERCSADVAQLVEHHLAKVRVAGSNPVVRSEGVSSLTTRPVLHRWSGREARQRTANPCTRVQIPSPPRAAGAAVARFPDTEEVTGSIPVSPTRTVGSDSRTGRFALTAEPRSIRLSGALPAAIPARSRRTQSALNLGRPRF